MFDKVLGNQLESYGYKYSTAGLTLTQKVWDILAFYKMKTGRDIMGAYDHIPENQEHIFATERLSLHGNTDERTEGWQHAIKFKTIRMEALRSVYLGKY